MTLLPSSFYGERCYGIRLLVDLYCTKYFYQPAMHEALITCAIIKSHRLLPCDLTLIVHFGSLDSCFV